VRLWERELARRERERERELAGTLWELAGTLWERERERERELAGTRVRAFVRRESGSGKAGDATWTFLGFRPGRFLRLWALGFGFGALALGFGQGAWAWLWRLLTCDC